MVLSDKQIKFCEEYLIDLNATQAAIRAGYSEKTANEQSSRLLVNVNIQEYISKRQEELSKKVQITQEMVLNELAKVGFSNIQDYFTGDLNAKDLTQLDETKAKAISSVKKTTTTFGDSGTKEVIEFKLYDKVKSLELIGKHLGFFEKDNKQSASVINTHDFSKYSYDQLKELLDGSQESDKG